LCESHGTTTVPRLVVVSGLVLLHDKLLLLLEAS
jgi:hypothetical protein